MNVPLINITKSGSLSFKASEGDTKKPFKKEIFMADR